MESEFGKLFLSNYRALDSIQAYGSFFEKNTTRLGDVEKTYVQRKTWVFFYIMRLPFFFWCRILSSDKMMQTFDQRFCFYK